MEEREEMKFISWNVNGIRACVQKGFMDFFKEADADIFCLQETKMQEGQLVLDLPEYHQYWNSAVKKGYSGTAIFTKKEPLSVTYGLGIEEHDQEGRVITLEFEDFYFITVYTPNSQSELARLDYRMTWEDAFRAYLKTLEEKKPVIFCGDLNVAHKEIDLKKAAKVVGEKNLELLPVKDINKVTGYIRGGCTPIGMKKAYPTVIHESAETLPQMIVSGGRLGEQIMLKPDDLIRAVNGRYADIISAK